MFPAEATIHNRNLTEALYLPMVKAGRVPIEDLYLPFGMLPAEATIHSRVLGKALLPTPRNASSWGHHT